MKKKLLDRKHADYKGELLATHRDLFAGGEQFHQRIANYLLQNEREPAPVYQRRCKQAYYENHCGPVGNHFASWLMTDPVDITSDPEKVDDFYAQFKEDCDGNGADFNHFIRARFVDALIDRCAYWRVAFPETPPADLAPTSLADWKASGAGRGILIPIPAASLINWKRDKDGFVWVMEYTKTCGLDEPEDDEETIVETWTIWRRDENHERYQLSYAPSRKPNPNTDIPSVAFESQQGMITGIPFATLELPTELWMMNLMKDPQLEYFRKRNGSSWAIDRTNFAMPIFNVKNAKKPPRMGTGYYLQMGAEDRASYLSPPGDTYATSMAYTDSVKQEIYRVTQQMARGVDNNAAAVGRSGASKQSDDSQTETVLAGFGSHVRDAVERTMDLISEGRGDDIEWSVSGMSDFNVSDPTTTITNLVAAAEINIPSPTHHREVAKLASAALLSDVDEKKRQQISDEIDAAPMNNPAVPAVVSPAQELGEKKHPSPPPPPSLPGGGVGGPNGAPPVGGKLAQPMQRSDELFRQKGPP